jgi:hypothetical protein
MRYYKLLTQEMTSYKDTKWEIGTPIIIAKEGVEMCSNQVLHCYNHPLLAVIFNSIHAKIFNPKLFEISVDKIVNTDGLKFASKSQTLIKEIGLPEITSKQKIEFAIKVAKLVYKDESWNSWADAWLSGEDCSQNSACTAGTAAHATYATYAALAAHAARAANAATCATNAANAADAATCATNAAYAAACDVAYATDTAYIASTAACAAASAANCTGDKNEFNQKMIDIIEEILDKQQS